MPADDDDAACTVAGVRKPSMDETAGRDTWVTRRALWGFDRRGCWARLRMRRSNMLAGGEATDERAAGFAER